MLVFKAAKGQAEAPHLSFYISSASTTFDMMELVMDVLPGQDFDTSERSDE